MATVAIIDGIKIELYFDDHPPPHFHARYAEFLVQIDIDTLEIINGTLPRPQFQTIRHWASSRQGQLRAAWDACRRGENPGNVG